MNWPTGSIVYLDSENVDGMSNALIPAGGDVFSWPNQGSNGTPFTRDTVDDTPLFKKSDRGQPAVAFDGRSDFLTCAGTASALKFLHTTGLFDIALTMRRTGGVNNGEHRVFGCEPTGLSLTLTAYAANTTKDGGYKLYLNDGVANISTLTSAVFSAELGAVSSIFIRGDGTQMKMTRDFWNWESQTFLATPSGTGNASGSYAVGKATGASGTDFWAGFDLLTFLIWNRNLNITEQLAVKANFDAQAVFL